MRVAAAAVVALALLGAAAASGSEHTFPGVNGEILYFSDDAPNLRNFELYAVSPAGGPARHFGDGDLAADADPAWSPDGRRLAFASERSGSWEVFVREPDGTLTRLTDDPATDRRPSWSPDGRTIAFDSDRRGAPEIHLVSSDGTNVERLTTNVERPVPNPNIPRPGDRAPDWSPDGRTIVFGRVAPGASGVYAVDAAGGAERRLTVAAGLSAVDSAPAWSPGGDAVAFTRQTQTVSTRPPSTLWLVRPDGSDEQPIPGTEYAFVPEWAPDGARLAFVRSGDRALLTTGRDGGRPVELAPDADPGSRPSWSPDGREIVFASRTTDAPSRPYRLDPATGGRTLLSGWAGSASIASPAWSPDGSELLVADGYRLAVMSGDGSRGRPIPGTGYPVREPAWSPDGSRVVFVRFTGRHVAGDLFVAHADGSHVRRLTRTWADESEPAWSPDGRWILFRSDRDGPKRVGDDTLNLIRPNGTDRRRLPGSETDERSPDWSPDGRRIVFAAGRIPGIYHWELWTMNADGSGRRRVQPARSAGGTLWADERPVWSPDGRWIAYQSSLGDDLFVVRPDGSDKTNLTANDRSREVMPVWRPLCSLRGTDGADTLRGGPEDELVCGFAGSDRLFGGRGRDRLLGGPGDDVIAALDGAFDVVGCGAGRDSVTADASDLVGVDCEAVRRA